LWPYLKNSIFQQPVDNLDELQHIIRVVEKIMKVITLTMLTEMGEEFGRAWMKAVAILIIYCKLFIAINKCSFDENLLFITNPKSEVQIKLMRELRD
jgi:hypothetical protein